jgi:cytochrome c556
MKQKISVLVIATVLSLATSWNFVHQDQELPGVSNRPFMQAKMDHAKGILEGLALENFDGIETSAQNLILLSHESAWNVIQSPDYIEMSSDFRASVGRLRAAAKDRNIDGATIAWFEVTLNCVRCHKDLRKKKHVPAPTDK